jgi:hypothetical protein
MSICQCITKSGSRCTRLASTKPGDNHYFCWQHQKCSTPIGLVEEPVEPVENVEIPPEPSSPVKQKSPPRTDIVPIKISPELTSPPHEHRTKTVVQPILRRASPRSGQKPAKKQVRFIKGEKQPSPKKPSPKKPSPKKPSPIKPTLLRDDGCITQSDPRETLTHGPHYEDLSAIKRNHNDVKDRLEIRHDMLTKRFGDEANFNKLTDADLKHLFELYDTIVFKGQLSKMVDKSGKKLKFNAGSSAERVAGSYVCKKDEQCLTISGGLFTNLFKGGEKGLRVNGLVVCDRLEALQIVFEHELVHLFIHLKGWSRKIRVGEGKMYYSSHGKLFQEIVFRLFGQTEFRHSLGEGEAEETLTAADCVIGLTVSFKDNKGENYVGKITACNPKTAKVQTATIAHNVPYALLHHYEGREGEDVEAVKAVEQRLETAFTQNRCRVGQYVTFKARDGSIIQGQVTKCNPTKARVD